MKGLIRTVIALLVGVVLGVGSAVLAIGIGAQAAARTVGGWQINLKAGSSAADPYTRAVIARVGLLALNQSEAVYFFRDRDDAGAPLREGCSYRLSGEDLPARWWSVTLYDAEGFLARNTQDAHSIDATSVVRSVDGAYEALIAKNRGQEQNFLAAEAAGQFTLTLRMYNPQPVVTTTPEALVLPRVTVISCQEGTP